MLCLFINYIFIKFNGRIFVSRMRLLVPATECKIVESYKNIDTGYFCDQSPIHQYYNQGEGEGTMYCKFYWYRKFYKHIISLVGFKAWVLFKIRF